MKAEVTISRTVSNQRPDCITLRVLMADRIMTVELTLEKFSLILTGMGGIEGEFSERMRFPRVAKE